MVAVHNKHSVEKSISCSDSKLVDALVANCVFGWSEAGFWLGVILLYILTIQNVSFSFETQVLKQLTAWDCSNPS